MNKSTMWHILAWVTALFFLVISTPFMLIDFIYGLYALVKTAWYNAVAENYLSMYLINKKNEAVEKEANTSSPNIEVL